MRVLILGGGIFIGRHMVDAALKRGHEVSVCSRFKSNSQYPTGVEQIAGDRYGDLSGLQNRHWDFVIDTSGYLPSAVKYSAQLLSNSVDNYIYISSGSVYKNLNCDYIDESSDVFQISSEVLSKAETIDKSESPTAMTFGQNYGALKAECERELLKFMPNNSLVVRAGIVVGPYDYTNRFLYWPNKLLQGGECLVPDKDTSPISFIDARDLAEWVLKMGEFREAGVYNATGRQHTLSFSQFLEECLSLCENEVELIKVSSEFIEDKKIKLWEELPLLLPEAARGLAFVDDKKAVEKGLRYRPLRTTLTDSLRWLNSSSSNFKMKVGLAKNRERDLIKEWSNLAN